MQVFFAVNVGMTFRYYAHQVSVETTSVTIGLKCNNWLLGVHLIQV